MVIVCDADRADRFTASAALKEKLQMNLIRHSHADIVMTSHLLSLFLRD